MMNLSINELYLQYLANNMYEGLFWLFAGHFILFY